MGVLVARRRLGRVAPALLAAAVGAIAWDAVKMGAPLSDLMFVVLVPVLAFIVVRSPGRAWLPRPVWLGAGLIAVSGVVDALVPTSAAYEEGRYQAVAQFVPTVAARVRLELVSTFKLEIGLLVLPLAVVFLATSYRRVRLLADLWVLSAVASCLVALSDKAGLTHISLSLLGAVDVTGRQAGLANNPNHLATVAVQTIPLTVYWMTQGGRRCRAGVVAAAVLCAGVWVSGSRGGLVTAVGALVVACLLLPRARRGLWPVLAVGAPVLAAIAVMHPSVVGEVAHKTRILSASGSASDQQRALVLAQALRDFLHRPLTGIGFDVGDQGHCIYLQVLASGGIVGLVGFLCSVLGMLGAAVRWRVLAGDGLAMALAVGAGAWLVMGAVENDLLDRYMYPPFALLVGLTYLAVRSTRGGQVPPGDAEIAPSDEPRTADSVALTAPSGPGPGGR
ncbi:MAG TPA: O-antigen ligase family protein [Acidimicrobiales bacterium]|nr:O-antigen ligase family protein [Acidimicrobiales bacterium]